MVLKENTIGKAKGEVENQGRKTSSDDEQRRPIEWAARRNGQSLASRKHRADPSCRLYSMQRRTVK
jgi:hypothetical protein